MKIKSVNKLLVFGIIDIVKAILKCMESFIDEKTIKILGCAAIASNLEFIIEQFCCLKML